jgi:hypothetical protein
MCMGGGGGSDKSNEIAQQQLALARQENQQLQDQNAEKKINILAGQGAIDRAFSQFNDPYYKKYQSDYSNALTTPLSQQYIRAKDTAGADLAARGIQQSSVGNQTLADIDQRDATQLGQIANQAADAANKQKSTVEGAKTNLYSLNSAGNDPSGVSANAIGSASALVNPQPQPTIGNVFADLLTPLANFYRAGQAAPSSGVTGIPTITAIGGSTG